MKELPSYEKLKFIVLSIIFLIVFVCCASANVKYPPNSENGWITHVTITTYNPISSQCDNTPLITADGTHIDLQKLKKGKIKYVAVSRNLLWALPYGSIIYIDGLGEYEVRDTMNERYEHCIDILQDIEKPNFKKKSVKIVLKRKGKVKCC